MEGLTMVYKNKYEDIITRDILIEEYCNKKRTASSIGRDFGICYVTIYKYLKLYGIEREDRKLRAKVGQKFGKLTTVRPIDDGNRKEYFWECLCDCGNIVEVLFHNLNKGNTKSCGVCSRGQAKGKNSRDWGGYEDISGAFFYRLKNNAKLRNIEVGIKIEDIWDKYIEQNKKCYLSNEDIVFAEKNFPASASVDRIDSNLGYTKDNIAICLMQINRMKSTYSKYEFIDICGLISNFNGLFIKTHNVPVIYKSCVTKVAYDAKIRNKNFELMMDDIQRTYCSQGGLCAFTGLEISFPKNKKEFLSRLHVASVDRMDNSIGYIPSNIQIVNKLINMSRGSLTIDEYKNLCKKIYEKHISESVCGP